MDKNIKLNLVGAFLLLAAALLMTGMPIIRFALVGVSVFAMLTCNKPSKKATIIIMCIFAGLAFVNLIWGIVEVVDVYFLSGGLI